MKTKLLFNINDVKQMATPKVFDRGVEYEENVVDIVRKGNVFEAEVLGSYPYHVNLKILKGSKLEFSCTCPYNYGGICKHSVALAIAILNDNIEIRDETKIPEDSKQASKNEKVLRNAKIKDKLEFLEQVIKKDANLRNQLIAFLKNKPKTYTDITKVNIDKIKKQVFDKLSVIDFNKKIEIFERKMDYYYDDYSDFAESIILKELNSFTKKAIVHAQKGNLLEATRIILSLYEGSQNLPYESEEQIYYPFEDEIHFNGIIHDCLLDEFKIFSQELKKIVFSNENAMQVLILLIYRYEIWQNLPSHMNKNQIIRYNFNDFTDILIALINNTKIADSFYQKLKKNDLNRDELVSVFLKIADIKNDVQEWIENAKLFAHKNPEIALQLLEKYKETEQEKEFHKLANISFSKWSDDFDLYLIKNINQKTNLDLYVKILNHYVLRNRNFAHYKKLRKHLSNVDINAFIDKINTYWDVDKFYIQVLEIEKKYEELLEITKKDIHNYRLDVIIQPIVSVYPDDCFQIVETRCKEVIISYNKGQKKYKQMCKCLVLFKDIDSQKLKLEELCKFLYNRKPNLPSLKNELIEFNLIK